MNFKKEISTYPNFLYKEKIIKEHISLRFLIYFLLTIFNLNFILNANLRANENFKTEVDAIIMLMEDFKKRNFNNQNLKDMMEDSFWIKAVSSAYTASLVDEKVKN